MCFIAWRKSSRIPRIIASAKSVQLPKWNVYNHRNERIARPYVHPGSLLLQNALHHGFRNLKLKSFSQFFSRPCTSPAMLCAAREKFMNGIHIIITFRVKCIIWSVGRSAIWYYIFVFAMKFFLPCSRAHFMEAHFINISHRLICQLNWSILIMFASEWCEITLKYDGSLDEPALRAYISINIPFRVLVGHFTVDFFPTKYSLWPVQRLKFLNFHIEHSQPFVWSLKSPTCNFVDPPTAYLLLIRIITNDYAAKQETSTSSTLVHFNWIGLLIKVLARNEFGG